VPEAKPAPSPRPAEPLPRPQGPPVPAPNQPQGVVEADASPRRVALLAMAFLAASVLVVVGLVNRGRDVPRAPSHEEVAKQLDLPLPAEVEADAAPPVIHLVYPTPSATAASMLGARADRPTIVLLAKPGAAADDAARLAADLHRRLRGRGVGVALVVPRESVVQSGAEIPVGAARDSLAKMGVRGDLPTYLDPTSAIRRALRVSGDGPVAVLLAGGREVLRASPASDDEALTLAHLAPLVSEALQAAALAR